MKTAVQGKRIIVLYRVLSSAGSLAGQRLALTKENGVSISKDADSTATKDGNVRTPGVAEIEITTTSLLAKGDTMVKALKDAMLKDELIEIWVVNLDEAGESENTFKGTYYQGFLTNLEESSPADDFVEESLTFGVNGIGVEGNVTVSQDMQDEANYVFRDAVASK